jgi:hypothetical protein
MTTVMPIDEPRRAGRCSASAPTGVAFLRLNIFSDARRATAGSMRGMWCGSRATKARCRTRRRIEFSRAGQFHRCFACVGKNLMHAAAL